MEVGQRVRARFITLPDQNASGHKKEYIYPIRVGYVAWIHPEGRFVRVKTKVRGGIVAETFRPWEVMT